MNPNIAYMSESEYKQPAKDMGRSVKPSANKKDKKPVFTS